MPARTAYAGAAVAGEVLTAANVNKIPGGWIGYAEVTANQTGITTEVDVTGLSIAVTVGASRRIMVSVEFSAVSSVAGDIGSLNIMEGGAVLQARDTHLAIATYAFDVRGAVVLTPAAGAHTYKATFRRSVGTGTLNTAANVNRPAFIHVYDLGPAT